MRYAEIEGIARALRGIGRRCRHANPLATGTDALVASYDALESDFEEFFPDLKRFAGTLPARGIEPESADRITGASGTHATLFSGSP